MRRNIKFKSIETAVKINKTIIAAGRIETNKVPNAKDKFVCRIVERVDNPSDPRAQRALGWLKWAVEQWNKSTVYPSRNKYPHLYADIMDMLHEYEGDAIPMRMKNSSFKELISSIKSAINTYKYNSSNYCRLVYLKDQADYREGQLVKVKYTVAEGRSKGFGEFYAPVAEADLKENLFINHYGNWQYSVFIPGNNDTAGTELISIVIPNGGIPDIELDGINKKLSRFGLQSVEEIKAEQDGELPEDYIKPLGSIIMMMIFMAEAQLQKVIGDGSVTEDGLYVNGCASEAVIYIIENLQRGVSSSQSQYGMLELQARIEHSLLENDSLFRYMEDVGQWCRDFIESNGIVSVSDSIIYSEKE